MTDAATQRWAAVTPDDAVRLLEPLSIRWWIAGGWALELTGDPPRRHGDLDVAVLRPDHERLRGDLADWDLRVAHEGRLRPWDGGAVEPPANAIWGRPPRASAWHVDFKLELVDGDEWVYRRDRSIRRPLGEIGAVTGGVPHLRREIAELYARGA